ncbi:MAG TPA: hypothetical protein VEQ63_04115, partial [Bryobacteraceae bacterium]|nr:hypothetical protein [Bryobacteraceae bacterium]
GSEVHGHFVRCRKEDGLNACITNGVWSKWQLLGGSTIARKWRRSRVAPVLKEQGFHVSVGPKKPEEFCSGVAAKTDNANGDRH